MNKCNVSGCINEGRYCRLHKVEKIIPLKTVKKVGDSLKEKMKLYRPKARKFITMNPKCKMCGVPSECIHHRAGRLGDNLLDESTWVALCFSCHRFVEENPDWAKENGYSDSRLTNQDK
jgi:hypothetical protein